MIRCKVAKVQKSALIKFVFKGNPGVHLFKEQILKSGFSKIEQNSGKEKTTKTPEHERTENSRHFALLDSKIGLETMEISYINDK